MLANLNDVAFGIQSITDGESVERPLFVCRVEGAAERAADSRTEGMLGTKKTSLTAASERRTGGTAISIVEAILDGIRRTTS